MAKILPVLFPVDPVNRKEQFNLMQAKENITSFCNTKKREYNKNDEKMTDLLP